MPGALPRRYKEGKSGMRPRPPANPLSGECDKLLRQVRWRGEFRERMFQVSVDESFSAGHALRGYKGKCENPHGHNYKVRVTLEGPQLDSVGMLYDFVHLKRIIHDAIQALDHKYLNDLEPFAVDNPSAENIAKYFYDQASRQLRSTPNGAQIKRITVWETDVTSATYWP